MPLSRIHSGGSPIRRKIPRLRSQCCFQFSHWQQQLRKSCSSRLSSSWNWHAVDVSCCERKTSGHVVLIFIFFLGLQTSPSKSHLQLHSRCCVSQPAANVDHFKLPNQQSEKSLLSLFINSFFNVP